MASFLVGVQCCARIHWLYVAGLPAMMPIPDTKYHVTTVRRPKPCGFIWIILIGFAMLLVLYSVTRQVSHYDYRPLRSGGTLESTIATKREEHEITFPQLGSDDLATSIFGPLSEEGVITYANVCIQAMSTAVRQVLNSRVSRIYYNETKKIVIYNADWNGSKIVRVAGSAKTKRNFWNLTFTTASVPSDVRYLKDKVAYFVSTSCPGNLHHFWEDEFHMLYSVVSKTGRLKSRNKNQMLYVSPHDLEPRMQDCRSTTRYQEFLWLLNFEKFHDAFFRIEPDTCYGHGVFGLRNFNKNRRDAVEYVLEQANISYRDCPIGDVITIVERQFRRILNIHELKTSAESMGYNNVQVVRLSDHTVLEQMRMAACSTVWVGVNGAGMEWSIFMRAKSTLIEIAWPRLPGGFLYRRYATPYGIRHKKLHAKDVQINFDSYETVVLGGKILTDAEKKTLLNSPPKSETFNIWKWADVTVDPKQFQDVLAGIHPAKVNPYLVIL